MRVAGLHRLLTADPADTSGLLAAVQDGLDPTRVVAVIGKTEGNGCVNDFTRGMAATAWRAALPMPVVSVMSGGTEGVLSPHVTIVAEEDDDAELSPGALVVGAGESIPITPPMLGRQAQVDAVATAVRDICDRAGLDVADVHFALVKCPLLTATTMAQWAAGELSTRDTYESMAHSRAASALGVALALGEIDQAAVERGLAGDLSVYSSVASTSAGVEVDRCEIVVLGHHPQARGPLRASHTVMQDAIDAEPVLAVLDEIRRKGGTVVQVFAKAEADPTGAVRGKRHTMLTDSDINSTRHARAAVGGLLAGLSRETALYVSGGAEHQGPPGGGTVTVVWSTT